jgi:hypothetical protein
MRIARLDQVVALERGMAFVLSWAIGRYLQEAVSRPPGTYLHWQEALGLGLLSRVNTRLERLHLAEQARPPRPGRPIKPSTFRIAYDELVALRVFNCLLQGAGAGSEELATALGRFHQSSTRLEHYIHFSGQ